MATQKTTGPWAAMLPAMPQKAVTAGPAENDRWEKNRWKPPSTPSEVRAYIVTSSRPSTQVKPYSQAKARAAAVPRVGTPTVIQASLRAAASTGAGASAAEARYPARSAPVSAALTTAPPRPPRRRARTP
ncbi:hypothetical protein LUX01_03115 [Streptomyces sudanensis]|uniref:hypothetical protein n=1 Tax=Streptomyces sudanensis TaxID=436397 RepID=UPI0020CC60E2|nr:hypothetical protein [Streptomyces sudanensis]MCP9985841.1 hypothetical protein [Streptomyces sudanensis]